MFKQGQEPEVAITISVPTSLAKFIGAAIESGSYMWVITHQNALKPGSFEHARTIREFPVPEILRSLEKHKEEFTEKVIQPQMARATATMVDSPEVDEKEGLRVIEVAQPGIIAPQGLEDIKAEIAKAREEHKGWE